MIDINTLLTYAVVVLGLFLIPGPAVLLVLARATAGGRRVGIATGLGIACGDLLHTVMATVGLSAILMTSALAFSIVKYAGAAYLIYLGVRALFERNHDLQLTAARLVNAPLAFRQAVLAELLNPKTALFFLAFLPQFVRPGHGAIGRAIGRIDEHRHAVSKIEATADHQAHACGLGRLVGAHDAGQRVAIDDGERLDAHDRSGGEQLLAGRRTAQEAEMRGHLQLGVARAAHPKIPCRNQRCEPVSGSSPSPAR